MTTMTKSELSKSIAKQVGITNTQALNFFETMIKECTANVSNDLSVDIPFLGSMNPMYQSRRKGKHPAKGNESLIEIPPRKKLSFSPSDYLKDAVEQSYLRKVGNL